MAKLKGPFNFRGNLNGISAYTMQGCDDIILRRSFGPSKEDVKNKPAYDITRRNGGEFGGRSTTAKWIKGAFQPLRFLSDYKTANALNPLLKPIQEMDGESEFGKRNVLISLSPHLLEGFSFNRRYAFDSVLRNPIGCRLEREQLRAIVEWPQMLPSLTFFPPVHYPYYRITVVLGLVPDMFYAAPVYQPKGNYSRYTFKEESTEWCAVKKGSTALGLELQLPDAPENEHFSLMLSVGIQMGTAARSGNIEAVRYTGCGKILAMK